MLVSNSQNCYIPGSQHAYLRAKGSAVLSFVGAFQLGGCQDHMGHGLKHIYYLRETRTVQTESLRCVLNENYQLLFAGVWNLYNSWVRTLDQDSKWATNP